MIKYFFLNNKLIIDTNLVRNLIDSQFPQWKHLQIKPVAHGGWDNKTFHLGESMLVRLPSAEEYAGKIEKEFTWLPILAPLLPLQISVPLLMGKSNYQYPLKWGIYRWIEGETAGYAPITNNSDFAIKLAQFLSILQKIDTSNGPIPGTTTDRGGPLAIYNEETRHALEILKDKIDIVTATAVWQAAIATKWNYSPVWVHGDISLGNLLVQNGRLNAIIDFGGLAIGDPACDLVIAWTFFKDESREAFRSGINLDGATWARARGWALWKALIIAAGICETNNIEGKNCWHIIDKIIAEHKNSK